MIKLAFGLLRIKQKFTRATWALNQLDSQLSRYLNFRSGFYIELGANDGLKQSNTMFLEAFRGWNGLLVEPHKPNFNKLIKNRSKENRFANCACVSFDYRMTEYRYAYSDLMTIGLDDHNDIPDRMQHAENGLQFLQSGSKNTILSAVPRTLSSLLDEISAPNIVDFLSLDVEGAELSVLQGIDFGKYQFKFILVESRDISKILNFLSKDYALVCKMSEHDYFIKNTQLSSRSAISKNIFMKKNE